MEKINICLFIGGVRTRSAKPSRLVGHVAASDAGRGGEAGCRELMARVTNIEAEFVRLLRALADGRRGSRVEETCPLGNETDAFFTE